MDTLPGDSHRTRLIATMLVAVALGLIVWAAKQDSNSGASFYLSSLAKISADY
jgi:hypothetical protein